MSMPFIRQGLKHLREHFAFERLFYLNYFLQATPHNHTDLEKRQMFYVP